MNDDIAPWTVANFSKWSEVSDCWLLLKELVYVSKMQRTKSQPFKNYMYITEVQINLSQRRFPGNSISKENCNMPELVLCQLWNKDNEHEYKSKQNSSCKCDKCNTVSSAWRIPLISWNSNTVFPQINAPWLFFLKLGIVDPAFIWHPKLAWALYSWSSGSPY